MTRDSFKKLFDMYFDEIRRYIYYRGGDSVLADDVTQQAFLRVWEKQINIISGSERALLYKIASNEFIDQLRKRKTEVDFKNDFRINYDSISPEEQLEYEELSTKYQNILNNMKENQRVVFLLSRKEGLKYHEIAERLNISVKAVEKRMKGALALLKLELKPE